MKETGFPSPFMLIMMLSPASRTSAMAAWKPGSTTRTTCPGWPRSAIIASSASSERSSGASSWPWNSTISRLSGSPIRMRSMVARYMAMERPRSIMVRSTSSTASGSRVTRCCEASIALRKLGNWQMPSTFRGLTGQSLRSSAAEKAKVPSEPTSSRARLPRPAARAAGVSASML